MQLMHKFILAFIFLLPVTASAASDLTVHGTPEARAYLQKIIAQNQKYIKEKGDAFFKQAAKGQEPIVTLVSCSDSRVQTDILDNTPEGDMFIIRNIGNQIPTDLGSIKYGIIHLHSQILLILGHSNCGAIKAASSDYSNLESSIVKELDALHIKKGRSNIESVQDNVNYQVELALAKFSSLANNNKLLVIGAVYDFANDMNKGPGKLNIINIQGEKLQ